MNLAPCAAIIYQNELMTVVTRFAPSPTGFLHIGGARTALFNWLYAKHHKGRFLLRIEDTDRARSTQDAIDAILDGMKWLGLDWEGEPTFQFARAGRHAEVAQEMVKLGHAFHCYTTQEELEEFRAKNPNAKFRSPWRDGGTPPAGAKSVVRLKAPLDGETVVNDKVQGTVTVKNSELDDMILLRSDGTPTYMLAVVVDDHDMGVTQVIRGDDHLTNTFRQLMIYNAMGWKAPDFAHIPLIHGADGAKLSKRHGALGVDAYREMGYLLDSMTTALARTPDDGQQLHPRELLERAGMALFDFIDRDPDGFRILVRDTPVARHPDGSTPDGRGTFAGLLVDVAEQVDDLLGVQFKQHGMSSKWAPMYAQMLVGMVAQTGQWWLDVRKPKKEEVVAHLVNLAWNGLQNLEPRPRSVPSPKG